jgi:predicted type IV restriction endonuclease
MDVSCPFRTNFIYPQQLTIEGARRIVTSCQQDTMQAISVTKKKSVIILEHQSNEMLATNCPWTSMWKT